MDFAGRANVERLAERTDYSILAAGRNAEKLDAVLDTVNNHRVSRCIFDVSNLPALRDTCQGRLRH